MPCAAGYSAFIYGEAVDLKDVIPAKKHFLVLDAGGLDEKNITVISYFTISG